jgi:hypothetical protein
MKKNQKFTVLRLLVLGLLVAGFNAKPASAQVLQGKFTLPTATRWGQATLPAGDYSFTLDKDYPGSVVTVLSGTKCVARIQTPSMSNISAGNSEIIMDGGAVREVNLPTIGVSLHYPVQHSGRRDSTREPQLSQNIPVSTFGVGR